MIRDELGCRDGITTVRDAGVTAVTSDSSGDWAKWSSHVESSPPTSESVRHKGREGNSWFLAVARDDEHCVLLIDSMPAELGGCALTEDPKND